jgi:hypothetical protein
MERLALCSKVLYDRDILEKHKQIIELEKKLIPPKIRFERYEHWEQFKAEMYCDVHAVLEKWIIHNSFQYDHMSYQGLTFRQENALNECIYEHLYTGTKDVEWSDKIAGRVVYSIRAMFNAMYKTQLWTFIYQLMSPEDIVELIYEHVAWYLDDDSHYPCVLDDVAEFKCIECGKIHEYINENQMCIECEITSSI